jgi:aubergine
LSLQLIRKPQFEFNLFRVDFQPEIMLTGLRKKFVYEKLGNGYLFDGQNMLYTTRRLGEDRIVHECISSDEKAYKMILKDTKQKIEMTDGMAMQILNIILRRTMSGLKMQEVGRNLYDPQNKASQL